MHDHVFHFWKKKKKSVLAVIWSIKILHLKKKNPHKTNQIHICSYRWVSVFLWPKLLIRVQVLHHYLILLKGLLQSGIKTFKLTLLQIINFVSSLTHYNSVLDPWMCKYCWFSKFDCVPYFNMMPVLIFLCVRSGNPAYRSLVRPGSACKNCPHNACACL